MNEVTAKIRYRLSMRHACQIFQLDPAPPTVENCNDYIVSAIRENDLTFFTYFLHAIEPQLNGKVYRLLQRQGIEHLEADRFLDYKFSCVLAMLECLPSYELDMDASFLTYAHYFIGNAMLNCRRYEEVGSFRSLDEYKAVRGIAWMYNESGKNRKETIKAFTAKKNCTVKTAAAYLEIAKKNRSTVPLYIPNDDGEEVEVCIRDKRQRFEDFLWNLDWRKTIRASFHELGFRDQMLLEKRNAVCLTCGCVKPKKDRLSFEELATLFEGSTAGGAEKAYKKAVEKLTRQLVEDGMLGIVELKLIEIRKKEQEAAYVYRAIHRYANDDDCWGALKFSFHQNNAAICKLADGDTCISHIFAEAAIRRILKHPITDLPKKVTFPIELGKEYTRWET